MVLQGKLVFKITRPKNNEMSGFGVEDRGGSFLNCVFEEQFIIYWSKLIFTSYHTFSKNQFTF